MKNLPDPLPADTFMVIPEVRWSTHSITTGGFCIQESEHIIARVLLWICCALALNNTSIVSIHTDIALDFSCTTTASSPPLNHKCFVFL